MDSSDDLRTDDARDPAADGGVRVPERLRRPLSRLLGMTSVRASRVAADALGAVGAHKFHYAVLATLDEFGPASQSAIADRTRIYRSDLVAVINELADGGWILRAPDPGDKRRNVVTVTGAGRDRLAELERIVDEVNDRILAPLDEDERRQLFDLLGRVNAHLAAEGGDAAW